MEATKKRTAKPVPKGQRKRARGSATAEPIVLENEDVQITLPPGMTAEQAAGLKVLVRGRPGLERVRPCETLNELACAIGMVASTARISSNVPEALMVSRVLSALADDLRPKSGGEWFRQLAPKAEDRLRKSNRGPRTRPAEASYIRSAIELSLSNETPWRSMGDAFIRHLECCPLLAAETRLAQLQTAEAVNLADEALQRDVDRGIREPERLAKAAMRAVGLPEAKARSLFDSESKAVKRAAR